ncbi:MAG: DUF2336 domain-containing protein [Rhodoferax sp.]|nr:DUF2336 domain-containing protein [Rhodoferax sp.]
MIVNQSLVDELETAIAGSDIGRRAAMLRRVADLFASSSGNLSDEQTAVFDDVLRQLVDEIEASARGSFAEYLALSPVAPPRILRQLALDDVIDVAGPVLSRSEQLDEITLAEGARTKSQAHLLAISTRKTIPESVTDILVERGNRQVALNAAANPGASFSEFGYSSLVRRSSDDDALALCTWSRREIPRRHLLKLFADASASLKRRLSKEDPRKAAQIADVVTRAANKLQSQTRETSADFVRARALVQSLDGAGKLDEAALFEFASAEKFAETVLMLSVICDLPVGLIERALVEVRSEQVLVLAKSACLSWKTTRAILQLQAPAERSTGDLDRLLETFLRLRPETARQAVQFYRLRERSLAASPS